ncbi:MAG TPA: hypothetical protein VJT73_14045 [Polyangiaceae bacterium]|nr:hypothetical protein [Polyangiaceae bacterium]
MGTGVGGIGLAMGSAIAGIGDSAERFNLAATKTARGAAALAGEIPSAAIPDTVSFSSAALAQASGGSGQPDALVQGLIDQGVAKNELAANVKVLRTADEMLGTLLDIKSDR